MSQTIPPPLQVVYAPFAGNINQDSLNRIFTSLGAATQRGVQTIHLLFESSGGIVGDGIALFNYFDSYPLELHIYNTGSVASVAVTSFLGVPHRYASAHATFMIHRTRLTLPTPGDAATHRATAANIEADDTRTEAIIRSRTTIPEDRWAAQAINDVTITAQEPCNSDSFRRYASSGLRPAIRSSISESVIATDLLQFKLTPMENTLENAEKFAAKCPTQNRIGCIMLAQAAE